MATLETKTMNNYRRGTILGLTVAETFLLLTFLLLFALIYLTLINNATSDATESLRNEVSEARETEKIAKQALEKTELALNEARADTVEARKAEELVKKELERTRHDLNEALAKNEKSFNSENLTKRAHDELRRELDEARADTVEARKAEELAKKELERTRHDLNEALAKNEKFLNSENLTKRAHDELRRELDEARADTVEARKAEKLAKNELERVRHELSETKNELKVTQIDLEHSSKGKNPPCWYREVEIGTSGKTREQPYYVFHVAIYENGIVLAPRKGNKPPQGYENEWKQLGISNLPFGKRLSDKEFKSRVKHLYNLGKGKKVRRYECVFSVKVWDKTPPHAKKRWKRAHDAIIESWFTAYTVQKEEWNGL